jgi:hypothetical protein
MLGYILGFFLDIYLWKKITMLVSRSRLQVWWIKL